VQESSGIKHTPPTAGRGFYEVVHRFDGHSAGGRGKNQLEAIYAIVGRDLENVGKHRSPLDEALQRVTKLRVAKTPRSSSISLRSSNMSRDEDEGGYDGSPPLHRPSSIRSGRIRSSAASTNQEHSPANGETPNERSRNRPSRVSFDIPSRGDHDNHRKPQAGQAHEEEDEEPQNAEAVASSTSPMHRRMTSRERDVIGELCRRMWDLTGEGAEGYER
jgi:hypothetical protein